MKNIEKELLLKKIDMLYLQEKHDQIIALIEAFDSSHDDGELTLLLARALLDSSVDIGDGLADAAEAVLMMIRGGMNDPLWHHQLARSFFFRGRIVEAAREISKAKKLAGNNDKYVTIAADLDELYDLCMQELPNYNIMYTPRERLDLADEIGKYYGEITFVDSDNDEFGVDIDIAVIKSDFVRDHDTYVTIGLGAYNMFGADIEGKYPYTGAELIAYIPKNWDDAKRSWMKNYMRMIAALPIERSTTIAIGHMFSNGSYIAPWTKFTASVLIPPQDVTEQAGILPLSTGKRIALLQLFPLYQEEMEYKLSYGLHSLINIMKDVIAVIDFDRDNECLREDLGSTLLGREIDLAGKDGSKYCAVSRKILDEGERVGYMRRHLNFSGDMISDNDSGWVFMSGTESREFLANPYNIKRCRLNTVCNIDSDILPFLNEPYNTTVYRKPDGVLTMVTEQPVEKDSLPPS